MITIEQRIQDYQALLLKEDGKTPAQWILGVIFGLKLALYIEKLK